MRSVSERTQEKMSLTITNMTHELISIKSHTKGRGFDIPFPNGVVPVPDTPGGYAISSGCGSGKTESIKSLIRFKYNDGILYCVDTISECQRMYSWVKTELVDNVSLKETDVMMINSQADFETMKTYQDHPEYICQKKVLIVVQVRFFIELINIFLLYRPRTTPQAFDGNFMALMASGETRKYIVFDETPLFLKPFITLTTGELAPYAVKTGTSWKCKSPAEIRDVYERFIRNDRKMGYNNSTTRLSSMKNDTVLNMIPKRFGAWISEKGRTHNIQFWPSDLIQPGMKSHVLLYEGAADILLGRNSKFQLLDLPNKYNAIVEFHEFQFDLERKSEPSDSEYKAFVGSIESILTSCQGGTLIVIWKDFKTGQQTSTPNDTYTDKLSDALVADGISQNTFSITYYGASDTKSTNVYRGYQNIILAGRWNLGGNIVEKLKYGFDCRTACLENYMLWYYVQLLLRIGIRNGNSGKYHVYYSSDHPDTFIFRLSVYLNQNIFIPTKIPRNRPLWEIMVQNLKMGKYYLGDIRKLVGRDGNLASAIESRQPYLYTLKLKDLAVLLPKKKKPQKDNYRSLIRFLGKINVKLQITR